MSDPGLGGASDYGQGGAPAALPGGVSDTRQGRVPDFFIAGHSKCGTTALYEMLKRHPQIFMPDIKELWFFSPELRSRNRKPSDVRPETFERYTALFAPARPEQRAGEASPSYLMSHTAAARIAEVQPDARIIAILREPAAFLRSFHMQCVRNHIETETDFARHSSSSRPGGAASRSRATARARTSSCTPSTCATSSNCAAFTRCSRRSRCWC